MTYFVYILQSVKTGRYYVGFTSDIKARLERHNQGRNNSTKRDRPWKIVHTEVFDNRQSAYRREKKVKKYKGGTAFKRLLHRSVA